MIFFVFTILSVCVGGVVLFSGHDLWAYPISLVTFFILCGLLKLCQVTTNSYNSKAVSEQPPDEWGEK